MGGPLHNPSLHPLSFIFNTTCFTSIFDKLPNHHHCSDRHSSHSIFLVSYYIIVIKCCLNLHRVSITQDTDEALVMHSPARLPKGLDQSAINSIPIVEFKKLEMDSMKLSSQECSVCLGEFQVNEKLRCLRDCSHLFHMDCIDVWLQNNTNCPLCRTSISCSNPLLKPPAQDLMIAETTTCVDSDFVVIEIESQPQPQQQQHQQLVIPDGSRCVSASEEMRH